MFGISNIASSKIDMETVMPFREKLAWLSLGAMVVAYGAYFAVAAQLARSGAATPMTYLALLGAVLGAQALVVIVVSVALAIQSGRDSRAPADERDRAIARRGAALAYFVLLVGMVLVGCVLPFSARGWAIINAGLLALVLAEVVRYGAIVWSYRRGWHG